MTKLPPFSRRYPWESPPNRLSLALMERRRLALPFADLTVSNPTQAELATADLAIAKYVPEASGSRAAREAVARYYAEQFGAEISPERIVLTSSTSEAYSYCFKLIADPGAEVLLPQPSYPLLQFLVEADGLSAVFYSLHHACGAWLLDRERLAEACTARTRAIVLVNPNNPTGHFLSQDDILWLREFSEGRYWLICDEVFADYHWTAPGSRSLTQTQCGQGFNLSGLSKICALPQMKLGWIVMPDNAAIQRNLELIADTYLSVSAPIQQAAPAWLAARAGLQAPIRERCLENLGLLGSRLDPSAWRALPVEAGWNAILQGPSHISEEDFALNLLEKGFLVQPGYYYDLPFPASIVISLLTPPAVLAEGLEAIRTS